MDRTPLHRYSRVEEGRAVLVQGPADLPPPPRKCLQSNSLTSWSPSPLDWRMEASELGEVVRVACSGGSQHMARAQSAMNVRSCYCCRQYYCSVLGHSPPLSEVGGILLRSERPTPHVRVPESSPQGVVLSDVAQR